MHRAFRGLALSAAKSRYFSASGFTFRAATASRPHPAKKRGEDAALSSPRLLAVADGVGGWAEAGVDAGEYARALVSSLDVERNVGSTKELVSVMHEAWQRVKKEGSTTCCAVALAEQEGRPVLYTANLGDSGFLLYSPARQAIIARGKMLQRYFNCPYQLGNYPESDTPAEAAVDTLLPSLEDIILLATDGLWDNLYDEQIMELLRAGAGDVDRTANQILRVAFDKSLDGRWMSPFSEREKECSKNQNAIGGKPDDITVIVAQVTPFSA